MNWAAFWFGVAIVTLAVVSVSHSNAHRAMDKRIDAIEATIPAYESRFLACEQTASRLVADVAQLDVELERAKKDRDVAFTILGDMRIAIEAVAATQKGRFRAPLMPRRARP